MNLRRLLWACVLPAVRLLTWLLKRVMHGLYMLYLGLLLLERDVLNKQTEQEDRSATEAEREAQAIDAAPWLEFCDDLKMMAKCVYEGPAGVKLSGLDRTEGIRFLTRLMRGGVEAHMETGDPAWPILKPVPYNVKLGADNPDNVYQYATVSGQYKYTITGTRGSVAYFSIATYSGSRPGQGRGKEIGYVSSSDLNLGPGRSFKIILSVEPPDDPTANRSNWLRLYPNSSRLVVRQTFLDKEKEIAASLKLERLWDGQPESKGPTRASEVNRALSASSLFCCGVGMMFTNWAARFAKTPNTFTSLEDDAYMSAWADPQIWFLHGYWGPLPAGSEEALLITVTPPECVYWNFQLNNVWMESLDYEHHPHTTTNARTASYQRDGSIALVVSHQDPHIPGVTWIDTAHHVHGTMALRWVAAKSHPRPTTTRTRISELQQLLQPGR